MTHIATELGVGDSSLEGDILDTRLGTTAAELFQKFLTYSDDFKNIDPRSIPDVVQEQANNINQFVTGKMSSEERSNFIDLLKADRALRIVTFLMRFESLEESSSALGSDLLNIAKSIENKFYNGNCWFPGAENLCESWLPNANSPIIDRHIPRELLPTLCDYYNKARTLCNSLIDQGQLEEYALENLYRMEQNQIRAKLGVEIFETIHQTFGYAGGPNGGFNKRLQPLFH